MLYTQWFLNQLTDVLNTGGEPNLSIPETINFGSIVTDEKDESGIFLSGPVPFRTIVMLISLLTHLIFSSLSNHLFKAKKISLRFDFFDVFEML